MNILPPPASFSQALQKYYSGSKPAVQSSGHQNIQLEDPPEGEIDTNATMMADSIWKTFCVLSLTEKAGFGAVSHMVVSDGSESKRPNPFGLHYKDGEWWMPRKLKRERQCKHSWQLQGLVPRNKPAGPANVNQPAEQFEHKESTDAVKTPGKNLKSHTAEPGSLNLSENLSNVSNAATTPAPAAKSFRVVGQKKELSPTGAPQGPEGPPKRSKQEKITDRP
ncbi:hypothetical protein COCOBI_12-5100 [Coccomyxa sp. Obi]|nr:hypothetical protein COCOBI_12-5100 [Coccomyxa sp. Obi]